MNFDTSIFALVGREFARAPFSACKQTACLFRHAG